MNATIEIDQSELDEVGLSLGQLQEAVSQSLARLHHPVNANPIYFSGVRVTVVARSLEVGKSSTITPFPARPIATPGSYSFEE